MTDIQMPRLSDTMEEGVISAWRKQVGDPIHRGDVVADIETDKAIMELEAYDDGVLEKVLIGEGETVPIGTPIGVLGDGSGSAASAASAGDAGSAGNAGPSGDAGASGSDASAASESSTVASDVDRRRPGEGSEPASSGGHRPKASPLAKAVAKDLGVDLATVTGSGPGGRVIRVDIEAAARSRSEADAADQEKRAGTSSSRDAEPTRSADSGRSAGAGRAAESAWDDVEEVPLSNIRKVTAKRLTESKQQTPHFYLTSAVDVTDLVAFRGDLNERLQAASGPKVSVNDLVVKAVATALRANPSLNVSFDGDKVLRHKRIHLGIAVALDSGLVVPVVDDADRKSVSEIAAESREKAERARQGTLTPKEMSGSTFSLSNLGMFGIEQFSAVINPPEAGILAIGATQDEVAVREGEFVARKIMRVTLSADHRAVDGAVGAVFLQQLTALLEDPIRILA